MSSFKDLLWRIALKIGRELINLFTRRVKNRILLMQESSCGSNSYALWKQAPSYIREKYDLILYHNVADEGRGLINFIKKYNLIASSKWIISTHGCNKLSKNQFEIQTWHGFIVKRPELRIEKDSFFKRKTQWDRVDFITSYSETYTTFFNAFVATNLRKYMITGAPRNDFFFNNKGLSNLEKIFNDNFSNDKIIFFLPTFRNLYGTKDGNRNYRNIFGFEKFCSRTFSEFLEHNNIKIIFKPHPHEENLFLNLLGDYDLKNLFILKDRDLKKIS